MTTYKIEITLPNKRKVFMTSGDTLHATFKTKEDAQKVADEHGKVYTDTKYKVVER